MGPSNYYNHQNSTEYLLRPFCLFIQIMVLILCDLSHGRQQINMYLTAFISNQNHQQVPVGFLHQKRSQRIKTQRELDSPARGSLGKRRRSMEDGGLQGKSEFLRLKKRLQLVSLLSSTSRNNDSERNKSLEAILGKKKKFTNLFLKKNQPLLSPKKQHQWPGIGRKQQISESLVITKTQIGCSTRKKYKQHNKTVKMHSVRSDVSYQTNGSEAYECSRKESFQSNTKQTVYVHNVGGGDRINNFKMALKFKNKADNEKWGKTEGEELSGWTRYPIKSLQFQ